jgi:cob(I)alamin adenosyltransferase
MILSILILNLRGELMKIYTKTGDAGETSIIGGRVSKDDEQVDAYGTVDEANSTIGVAISFLDPSEKDLLDELEKIQHELFDCGGDLSMKAGAEENYPFKVTEEMVFFLEERIDQYMKEAPTLERFILPGGSKGSAFFHVARTVVRRAERRVVTLSRRQPINPFVRQYLNRLSDYLFALARVVNLRAGQKDVEYVRSAKVFTTKQKKKEE